MLLANITVQEIPMSHYLNPGQRPPTKRSICKIPTVILEDNNIYVRNIDLYEGATLSIYNNNIEIYNEFSSTGEFLVDVLENGEEYQIFLTVNGNVWTGSFIKD